MSASHEQKTSSDGYSAIRLPNELLEEIDQIIKRRTKGYKSRPEFIKEAIRKSLAEIKAAQPTLFLPSLEHFNIDETGVRILDRTISSKSSSGRIIDVFFKPDAVWCDYCQASKCQHVKFALELEAVQEVLARKGWKVKT